MELTGHARIRMLNEVEKDELGKRKADSAGGVRVELWVRAVTEGLVPGKVPWSSG